MQTARTRVWGILLAFIMLLTMLPTTVLADDTAVVTDPATTENNNTGTGITTADALQSAITSATGPTELSLGDSISLASPLTISDAKTITLDLNGHTLNAGSYGISVTSSSTLTIKDSSTETGKITAEHEIEVENASLILDSGTIDIDKSYGVYVSDGGSAIVNGGTITSLYAPLGGNNTTGDMNFAVHGGTLTAKMGPAIYMPGQVTLEITSGTLNGGVSLRMGQVTISGGTINATNGDIDNIKDYYNGQNVWLADALFVFNGTYTSENTTYGNSLNLKITGGVFNCGNKQGSAIAVYDLARVDQNSTITISDNAQLITNATNRSAYDILSVEDVGVTDSQYGITEYEGKVFSSITGGTFSTKPDDGYIPIGYAATQSSNGWTVGRKTDGMEAGSTASGTTSTGTVGGSFVTNGSNGEGVTSDQSTTIQIDVTTGTGGTEGQPTPAENVTTTNVTIASDSLTSVSGATTIKNVAIATDVGTLTVSKTAWDTITENAGNSAVTLTVSQVQGANTQSNQPLTYELIAVDANNNEVFAPNGNNGTITVSVPAPSGASTENVPKVYCLGPDGAVEMDDVEVTGEADKTLSWTVTHFSTYVVTETDAAFVVTTENGGQTIKSYNDLEAVLNDLNNIGTTEGNVIINLVQNSEHTLSDADYELARNVTINGDGATITAKVTKTPDSTETSHHAFTVTNGNTLTLHGVTVNISDAENDDGALSTYGFDVRYGAKLILDDANVTISNVTNATISASQGGGTAPGVFQILNGSVLKGKNIRGNFSNGGNWTVEDSDITIDTCSSYGMSVTSLNTTGDTNIDISNTTFSAIYGHVFLTFDGNTEVTVTNCGPKEVGSGGAQYGYRDAPIQLRRGPAGAQSITIGEDATITITGCTTDSNEDNNKIYVVSGTTYKNDGTVNATVVMQEATGDTYRIIYTVNDQTYYTVSAEATGAEGSKTITYSAPDTPTDLGSYRFDGWDYDDVVVTDAGSGMSSINVSTYPPAAGNTYTFEAILTYTGSTGSSGSTRYNITIEDMENGGVTSSHSRASRGTTVTLTINPDEGYELDELIVTDANGDEIDLTRKSSTKYTFEMPRSRVTVEATFVEEEVVSTLPFDDVDVDDWFYDAVEYAYENDLMNGVSDDEFDPNGTLTRGMMVTVLYRLEGEPESRADLPFEDVEPGTWYTEAVRWAVEEGIVLGTSDTTYEPDAMITREQLATMLYRYAAYKDYDTTQGGMAIREFADYEDISDWALEGLDWAVNAELVNGVGNNTIAPLSSATRAETATLLMRFIEAFEA